MERKSERLQLADRFARMAAAGLLDVKFFVRNPDEAMTESVCREVNRLYEAVESGEARKLGFQDASAN